MESRYIYKHLYRTQKKKNSKFLQKIYFTNEIYRNCAKKNTLNCFKVKTDLQIQVKEAERQRRQKQEAKSLHWKFHWKHTAK